MDFVQFGDVRRSILPDVSARRALVSATLVGLAWFPLKLLAIIVGNTIAGSLVLHTSHPTSAQFQVFSLYTDVVMLVVSSIFCLLLVPWMFRVSPQRYRTFLQEIGVLGGSWRAIAATASLVVLVIVLLFVYPSVLVWHVDVHAWLSLAQPALVEETLFRGIALALLLRRFPAWFAA